MCANVRGKHVSQLALSLSLSASQWPSTWNVGNEKPPGVSTIKLLGLRLSKLFVSKSYAQNVNVCEPDERALTCTATVAEIGFPTDFNGPRLHCGEGNGQQVRPFMLQQN